MRNIDHIFPRLSRSFGRGDMYSGKGAAKVELDGWRLGEPILTIRCLLVTAVLASTACASAAPSVAVTLPVAPPLTTSPGSNGLAVSKAVFRLLCPSHNRSGTAFADQSGLLLTAYHVIQDCPANDLEARSADGRVIKVSTAIWNVALDVAALTPTVPLSGPRLQLSTRPQLDFGIQVSTWGFPEGYLGANPLLSVGYLAGEQPVPVPGGIVTHWVINAAFNAGNSGGPVFDLEDGTVIGIVDTKLAPIPQPIIDAIKVMTKNPNGVQYPAVGADGKPMNLSEAQIVAAVLDYLHSQTQLGIGTAIKSGDVTAFLKANKPPT